MEHVNAINWLNEFSDKKFYLIQVEAYKIDESNPAPFFSVICRPTETTKSIGKSKKVMDEVRSARRKRKDLSDTLIVPARKDGFDKVFLGENSWYSIRIKEERLKQIKYIAGYQVAPISAITHVAEVKEIVPADEPGKFKVLFKGEAKEISPIKMGKKSKIQGPAYCEFEKLRTASSIDDLLTYQHYTDEDAA
jgi:hypothetical protein